MAGVAFCEMLKIDGSLARNIVFEVANLKVPKNNRRKTLDFDEVTKYQNYRKSLTKF